MSKLRVVSYAINGRGMGHLVRQLAILRWVRRISAFLDRPAECWVLTSSEADTLARREGVCGFKMPSKAMMRDAGIEPARYLSMARAWTLNIVAGLQPDLLMVDTFPGGSFGELIACLEMAPQRVLVARKVREEIATDPGFAALVPLYQRTIEPDDRGTGPILIRERAELMSRAEARVALGVSAGDRVVYLTLGGGGDVTAPRALPRLASALAERGYHVVVGAGPLYDGPERRGPRLHWMNRYVPMELFAGFDAAVSAAGYNAFHELMFAGVPTVFAPQPRISDDQEERARRAEAAGAGRVAATVDDIPALLDELMRDPDAGERARALVPHNGARAAALAALSSVFAADDLALAARVLTPELLAAAPSGLAGPMLEVVRILAGGPPAEVAARRSALAELAERGVDVSAVEADLEPGDRIERFFAATREHEVPLDHAVSLLRALRRKFPAAGADAITVAIAELFAAWARFDDWMGAVSLMRAVPVQRSFGVRPFARDTAAWLALEDDLFDALRAFAKLEASGARPVAEVLRLLAAGSTSAAGADDRLEADT